MKITFIISSMSTGGAERVANLLCNSWVESGHHVDLITFEGPSKQSDYPLDEKINYHQLDLINASSGSLNMIRNMVRRVQTLKKMINDLQSDIVVSFMLEVNILATLAAKLAKKPIVISERVHPAFHPVGRLRDGLRKLIYPKADKLVVQTKAIKDWFHTEIPKVTPYVIANPVEVATRDEALAGGQAETGRKKMLAVGRLDRQKGYDILIKVFASLAEKYPEWDLTICGEGPQRQEIEAQIASTGMKDRINLLGFVREVGAKMQECDLFIHASRYEGFPNVIVEALSYGCSVIATDESGGVQDILKENEFGIVSTHDKLESDLDSILSDQARRRELSTKSSKAVAPYKTSIIADAWIKEFEKIV